ncbi:MAG: hypothetical protein PHX51_05030 [Clostridia bacterium]|nr:hypothetical protein [Clostridia bacterium]
MDYKEKALCITMVKLFKRASGYAKYIDDIIYKKAISSHCFHSASKTTYATAVEIVTLTNLKKELLYIKLCVDRAFSSFTVNEKKYFVLRFIDRQPPVVILKTLNVRERSFYRIQANVFATLFREICEDGYSLDYIKDNLYKEKWIRDITENTIEACRLSHQRYSNIKGFFK